MQGSSGALLPARMKVLSLLLFLSSRFWLLAAAPVPHQPTKVGFLAGVASYHGDICSSMDCLAQSSGIALGVLARYHMAGHWYFSPQVAYQRIQGDDQYGPQPERNLSFRSDNLSFSIAVQYAVREPVAAQPKRMRMAPYLGLGVGGLFFQPKAQLDGEWIALQPLQTEGKSYALFTPFICPEIGASLHLRQGLILQLSYRYQLTFSDYLDDVSGEYVDQNTLLGVAAALADRSAEGGYVPASTVDGIHWSAGSQRGSKAGTDAFSMFYAAILLDLQRGEGGLASSSKRQKRKRK